MFYPALFHRTQYKISFFVFIFILFLLNSSYIYAQHGGIANTYNVIDNEAVDGDLMAIKINENAFVRATDNEGEDTFGIYVEKPTVVLRTDPAYIPIVREGDVYVNVTTLNGAIAIGDGIVASSMAGKGQKAGESRGTAIGTALEAFNPGDGSKITFNAQEVYVGKIKVALRAGSSKALSSETAGGIINQIRQLIALMLNMLKKGEDISQLLRFIVAGIVAAITVYMAFTLFGRNISKGIEAIGRNPLAKISIQSMIIVNIVLIAVVTIGGVLLTLVIIKF